MPKPFFFSIRHLHRRLSSSPSFISRQFHSQNPNPLIFPSNFISKPRFNPNPNLIWFRSFSIHSPNPNDNDNNNSESESIIFDVNSNNGSEIMNLGFADGGPGVGTVSVDKWYDPFVNTLISVLDGYHDLTGFPWWVIIVSSTLALRAALFPLLVLQLGKMKTFSELFPKCKCIKFI